ncbi:N-acetylmuramoyl-L-alanine amidase family protein [Paenimyroides baculatum]|uniref:N-acetylmuramoyl-L-alanine amidase n=1 Tax=Paenimyroides baculatum TaxID=2608000 RepID=A0A5M6CA99_9FLAO|nr:N-acetylmuramoyl-L-alanine amidase [Paenimyroides baculatum]KAA5532044.1 N-acetylmuramoyl-L-alanine amidase [Paenimyroides baculatum]
MFIDNFKVVVGAFLMCVGSTVYAQNFKVVLDPGHGGKDFGAVRGNYVEKKIVLDVAEKVGDLLKRDKGISVIYTRKSDVFLELRERTEIANREKADIFVSIHANAASNAPSATGTETFIMGTSKNASNLEIAKKENAVITLEDNYETSYSGYDPSKPESLIGLTLIQEQFVTQSIELASKVQTRFTNDAERKNRGVKQAPFVVLYTAFMPSVLVELGFLSNSEEGAYLNSEEGKNELARGIANAIIDYKKQYHSASENISTQKPRETPVREEEPKKVDTVKQKVVEPAQTSSVDASKPATVTKTGVSFKVQISASSKDVALTPSNFNGLNNISVTKEGNMFKYFYNETTDYDHARKALEVAKNKGYNSAFLVAYKNGKKVSIKEAINK